MILELGSLQKGFWKLCFNSEALKIQAEIPNRCPATKAFDLQSLQTLAPLLMQVLPGPAPTAATIAAAASCYNATMLE